MKLSRGFGDAFRRIAAPVQKLFGGLFGKRRRGRAGLWQDDLMYPPDIRSVDDIRNNPLVGPKVKFLERYHPILLARMGLSLTAASRNFTDSRDMLESLRKKREEKQSNIAKIAREQPLPSEIFLNEQDRPEREAPSEKGILEIVLAISNAFILTLGLLDFVGVSIRHVRTDREQREKVGSGWVECSR